MTRLGGIAPTISIVTAIYVLLSFVAMIIHAFVSETDAWNRIHFVVQIMFFTGATLCVVFLSMARAGAIAGLDFDKSKAMSPRELHDLLALHESSVITDGSVADGLKINIKKLREVLLYSFNESSSLAQSQDYQVFSGEVQDFCYSVKQGGASAEDAEHYNSLKEKAKNLIAKNKH